MADELREVLALQQQQNRDAVPQMVQAADAGFVRRTEKLALRHDDLDARLKALEEVPTPSDPLPHSWVLDVARDDEGRITTVYANPLPRKLPAEAAS